MKKNFAAQPEVMEVLTAQDLFTEVNPMIINSEDIFNPNPLQNFYSDSPNSGNYRSLEGDEEYLDDPGGQGGFKFDWNILGNLATTGLGLWGQSNKAKADKEQADKAAEIARLQLEKEKLEKEQQEGKSTTFRKYGVPLILASVVIVGGLSAYLILRKK